MIDFNDTSIVESGDREVEQSSRTTKIFTSYAPRPRRNLAHCSTWT